MVTLTTRIDEIYEIEGFKIVVKDDEEDPITLSSHGILERYSYKQALSDDKTVADWKRLRFKPTRDYYTCEVVTGDGTRVVKGDTTLGWVRDNYA